MTFVLKIFSSTIKSGLTNFFLSVCNIISVYKTFKAKCYTPNFLLSQIFTTFAHVHLWNVTTVAFLNCHSYLFFSDVDDTKQAQQWQKICKLLSNSNDKVRIVCDVLHCIWMKYSKYNFSKIILLSCYKSSILQGQMLHPFAFYAKQILDSSLLHVVRHHTGFLAAFKCREWSIMLQCCSSVVKAVKHVEPYFLGVFSVSNCRS